MRLIDADRSDEIIIFDKQNELLQCSVVRDYCERQREFLNKFPTIDAEPVVRCKNCKYSNTGHAISDKSTWCDYWGTDPDFDDFCSHGERKGSE